MKELPIRHHDTYFRADHFLKDVGIQAKDDLERFDLIADDTFGRFEKPRFEEIVAFCRKNPEFHVVSFMPGGIMLNFASKNARWYFIGDGDANPRLVAKDYYGLRMVAIGFDSQAFAKRMKGN